MIYIYNAESETKKFLETPIKKEMSCIQNIIYTNLIKFYLQMI